MGSLTITKAIPTGKSSGKMIEFQIPTSGKKCFGKVYPSDTHTMIMKVEALTEEIEIIAKLSHENIVKIKGVCFLPDRIFPVILIQKMMGSLQSHFQNLSSLSVRETIDILQDTASGLSYLHNLNPPFVHGEIMAENVLLDTRMRAKIGGFAIESRFQRFLNPMYIPPEAQEGETPLDLSLDMFSFGHLALCTILQEEVQPEPTKPPKQQEVDRRARFIEKARKLLTTKHEAILGAIQECLRNNPVNRPSIKAVQEQLQTASRLISVIILCMSLQAHVCISDDETSNPGEAERLQSQSDFDKGIVLFI